MEKATRYSETDLAYFYAVSPVFKRYSQLNLWSENFSEYNNIKYCEIYLSQYFLGCTQKYILENFSESFLLTLHNSPKFLKFLKSGFFKYINYHFLLLFQNNRFFFGGDSFKEVEIFVEEYFQRYIQNFFEQDLLTCLVSCINEIVPKSFREYLNNRLEFVYKELLIVESNTKFLLNSVVILNLIGSDKNKYYSLGFIDYKNTIKNFYFERFKVDTPNKIKAFYFILTVFPYKIYKSLGVVKEIPGVIKPTFFLEDTIYCWGHCITSTYKKVPSQIFNYGLFDLSKTSIVFTYFIFNREVGSSLNFHPSIVSRYRWCFYTFSKGFYKAFNPFPSHCIKKDSNNYNHDFYFLLESYRVLISFDKRRNDIAIYRSSVDVFFEDIKPLDTKLIDTAVMRFSKPFECTFNAFFNKIYLVKGLATLTEYDKVLLIACKKAFKNLESSFDVTFKEKSLEHFFEENCGEFCLNINDIFNSKFKNSYTNLKVIKKDSSDTSKVVFANIFNTFKGFYQCFGEEFTITTPVNNLSKYNKIVVKNIILYHSFIQSKKRWYKIMFFVFLLKNFSNRWGLYSCRNLLNINKSLFLFHINFHSYRYLFKCNCVFSFSDRFYTIKMNLLYNFCFFSSGLCNKKFKTEFLEESLDCVSSKDNKIFSNIHGNFLLKNKKNIRLGLEEEVNGIYDDTNKVFSKKTVLEVSDYEDDEDVLEEFVVDLFSK
uniref:Uncharacterized protein n=1 Tax=Pleurophycus gardneri TaxID=309362 RepID=A0A8F0FD51_9PHAE|nr:hypothetical protein [Pleurophycus gardneri]